MMDLAQQDAAGSHAAEIAEQTESYIRNHYAEALTNGSLADVLHFHYNYLARCMKRAPWADADGIFDGLPPGAGQAAAAQDRDPHFRDCGAHRLRERCLLLTAFCPQSRHLTAALPQALFTVSRIPH